MGCVYKVVLDWIAVALKLECGSKVKQSSDVVIDHQRCKLMASRAWRGSIEELSREFHM